MPAPRSSRPVVVVAAAAFLLALTAGSSAAYALQAPSQPAAAEAGALPSATQVNDKFIAATGGREAYEKVTSRVTANSIVIAPMNMKGSIMTYHKAPNSIHVLTNITNVEKNTQVFDGTRGWTNSTTMGPRIPTGDELNALVRQATFNSELHPEKLFKTMEVTGHEEIDGKDCYKVVSTPEKGSPVTSYYEVESGLLVKIIVKVTAPTGVVESTTSLSDYKPVDGVSIPHKASIKITGQPIEIQLTTDKVEHNVEIDPALFVPPADIQKLLDKQAAPAKPEGEAPAAPKPAAAPATPPGKR